MTHSPSIDIVAGAGPNFIKIAPIIAALRARELAGGPLRYRLIHTGQHYHARMSADFFSQLGIPEPDVNLEVGSGTQAEQTSGVMVRYEKLLLERRSDLCLVVGDFTSTLACSIAARKLGIDVAHVEGGLRSGDWSMPEEINRLVTDAVTSYFFTTSEHANENLRRSGVAEERIFFVGNTMIDTLMANMQRLRPPPFWHELELEKGSYFIVTLHRPANVDDTLQLSSMLTAIGEACRGHPVLFPRASAHSEHSARGGGRAPQHPDAGAPAVSRVQLPCEQRERAVITDSGGITEETTVMGVPCMTLRNTTERPETVAVGTNELIGTAPSNLKPAMDRLFAGNWKKGAIPQKWDGRTGERIVAMLETLLRPRRT